MAVTNAYLNASILLTYGTVDILFFFIQISVKKNDAFKHKIWFYDSPKLYFLHYTLYKPCLGCGEVIWRGIVWGRVKPTVNGIDRRTV